MVHQFTSKVKVFKKKRHVRLPPGLDHFRIKRDTLYTQPKFGWILNTRWILEGILDAVDPTGHMWLGG